MLDVLTRWMHDSVLVLLVRLLVEVEDGGQLVADVTSFLSVRCAVADGDVLGRVRTSSSEVAISEACSLHSIDSNIADTLTELDCRMFVTSTSNSAACKEWVRVNFQSRIFR